MNRIDQRTKADCLRCCLAMVLDLPYEDVPDFVADRPTRWLRTMTRWASDRSLDVVRFAAPGNYELLHEPSLPGVAWIASGPTERGTNHAIVYVGPDPFHDPHSSRAGLLRITAATVLVPRVTP